MRKCLSLVLAIAMLLCLIPGTTAFAAKEMFKEINQVSVNEVYSPAAGTEVQFSANCETNYVALDSVSWYEKTSETATGTALSSGAKFKPGYYYTVCVQLKISNNAYYFSGNGTSVTATVNGKAATVTTKNSAQVIKVERTFPMCLGTVNNFEFNLAAPTAGAAPHYPLMVGTGYKSDNRGNNGAAYKNGIYWRNETDSKVIYPDDNPKFEAGKTYSANITVATTTGYRVSTSYTVKVNGKTVNSTRVDNECITFKVLFTVPKAHTHTPSQWKSDANNHWKVCTDTSCGAIAVSNEAHKDANKDNKCDVCGYAIPVTNAPVTSNPVTSNPVTSNPVTSNPVTSNPVTSNPATSSPTASTPDEAVSESEPQNTDVPTTGDNVDTDGENEKGNGLILWIIIGAVVVLAAAGAVVFIVLKKKKAK